VASRWLTRFLYLITLVVIGGMGWFGTQNNLFGQNIKRHPPGVLVANPPGQYNTFSPQVQLEGFTVTPRAQFQITARVLAKKRYRFDTQADLIPYDFAMGWGVMSDSALIDRLHIKQSQRWYHVFTRDEGVDLGAVAVNSANMHLIPIDSTVRKVLDKAVVGDLVTLTGDLVDVAKPDFTINTSLTRSDTGGGACEIILVRSAVIVTQRSVA
jgi:hypothetical protein